MSLEEWQKHVRHTHAAKLGTAWCGETVSSWEWCYLNIDHAAYSAPKDRIQPCPACVAAITTALAGN